MILPLIAKLVFCLVGLALSVVAVWSVCYVAFMLLNELMEDDDGNN